MWLKAIVCAHLTAFYFSFQFNQAQKRRFYENDADDLILHTEVEVPVVFVI